MKGRGQPGTYPHIGYVDTRVGKYAERVDVAEWPNRLPRRRRLRAARHGLASESTQDISEEPTNKDNKNVFAHLRLCVHSSDVQQKPLPQCSTKSWPRGAMLDVIPAPRHDVRGPQNEHILAEGRRPR